MNLPDDRNSVTEISVMLDLSFHVKCKNMFFISIQQFNNLTLPSITSINRQSTTSRSWNLKPSYHLNIQPIKLKFLVVRIIITTILFIPKMVSRRKKQKRKRKKERRSEKKEETKERKNRMPLPTVSTVVHTYLRQLVRCQDCWFPAAIVVPLFHLFRPNT